MKKQEMQFIAHLGELRKRLIYTLIAFILLLFGSFIYVKDIYSWLIRDLDFHLAVLGPSEILWVYFIISGVIAIALTIPIATHQTWLFLTTPMAEGGH